MTYCFKCPECGARQETRAYDTVPWCLFDHGQAGAGPMARDYRTEAAAPATLQLKREREAGGRSAIRDLFLPTTEDFKGPSDPDGEKGLRAWADETKPKDGNTKPLWPEMKKKTHAVGGIG